MDAPRPSKHFWTRRKLVCVLLLVGLSLAAYWVVPWVLMPDDMRQMLGRWKFTHVVSRDKGEPESIEDSKEVLVIHAYRMGIEGRRTMSFSIEPTKRKLTFFHTDASEYKLFGFSFHVPIWPKHAPIQTVGQYEIKDGRLLLWLKAEEDDEQWMKFYLERE